MENKEEAMLKMRQMSIEEKIAMLSEKDEAYIRGFIEGTIYWIHQTAQKKDNGKKAVIAKPKSPKTSRKARLQAGKNN
jgi:hypothetical protein